MLEDEFAFYLANQKEIVTKHLDEFVVVKGPKIVGYYKTEDDAFDAMAGEKLGTFMVKKCQLPGTDIVEYFNNAVTFA
jgi:hypothetical protein